MLKLYFDQKIARDGADTDRRILLNWLLNKLCVKCIPHSAR